MGLARIVKIIFFLYLAIAAECAVGLSENFTPSYFLSTLKIIIIYFFALFRPCSRLKICRKILQSKDACYADKI